MGGHARLEGAAVLLREAEAELLQESFDLVGELLVEVVEVHVAVDVLPVDFRQVAVLLGDVFGAVLLDFEFKPFDHAERFVFLSE